MKAAIAGGGIGGLAAAVALALRGWDVTVLEQAPALTEVGAGLQIAPNGWRVLDAMGVTPLIADTLFEPEMIEMRDSLGFSLLGAKISALWAIRLGRTAAAGTANRTVTDNSAVLTIPPTGLAAGPSVSKGAIVSA